MFSIKVHNYAPERIKKSEFLMQFFVGTHRKFSDCAENELIKLGCIQID